jgi:flagellar basal-body rod protein FlgF
MENNLYIGLSRQVVLQAQMDMVANNVANINTPGYRGQSLLFSEFVADPRGQDAPYSMVYDYGQYVSTAPGAFQNTGGKLDVALQGPGFFQINTPQGPRYSRAGNFTLDQTGQMITPNGDLLGVAIPAGAREINIDEQGNVSTETGIVGRINMVEFASTQNLVREGNGLYRAPDGAAPGAAANTRMMQGMLEGSNVQGVVETTRMIGILRDYQSLQRLMQSEHELERNAIGRLTQRN